MRREHKRRVTRENAQLGGLINVAMAGLRRGWDIKDRTEARRARGDHRQVVETVCDPLAAVVRELLAITISSVCAISINAACDS